MRVGIVSDSHGILYMLNRAICEMGEIDLLIHLGDNYHDIIKVNDKYKKPIEYVTGNNELLQSPVYDKIIILQGMRILITHGHKYHVSNGLDFLYLKAISAKVDLVLYGHTHIQSITNYKNIIFLNPGSVARPRDAKPGFAVVNIDEAKGIEPLLFRIDL